MLLALSLALSLLSGPTQPQLPNFPVLIEPDKQAYQGKDQITVSIRNPHERAVWVAPYIYLDRSNGDGTWTSVYKLRTVQTCHTSYRPPAAVCRKLAPNERLTLPPWDWNTGGYDQCPPRRPGHRAFKGVYRLTLSYCDGKAPKNGAPRTKLVTWE